MYKTLFALAVTSLLIAGCVPFYNFIHEKTGFEIPHDNAVEEFVEDVIEKYTGHDIDLTPGSPE